MAVDDAFRTVAELLKEQTSISKDQTAGLATLKQSLDHVHSTINELKLLIQSLHDVAIQSDGRFREATTQHTEIRRDITVNVSQLTALIAQLEQSLAAIHRRIDAMIMADNVFPPPPPPVTKDEIKAAVIEGLNDSLFSVFKTKWFWILMMLILLLIAGFHLIDINGIGSFSSEPKEKPQVINEFLVKRVPVNAYNSNTDKK